MNEEKMPDMAEKEARKWLEMKKENDREYRKIIKRGQVLGFILGLLVTGTLCVSIILGHTNIAIVPAIISIASLAAVLIRG